MTLYCLTSYSNWKFVVFVFVGQKKAAVGSAH
jgi:hypothetical protein